MTPAIDLPSISTTTSVWKNQQSFPSSPTASMYARFWNFLLQQWQNESPSSCRMTEPTKRRRVCPKSPTTEMRVHVRMLHELEALSPQKTSKTGNSVSFEGLNAFDRAHRQRRQAVCFNCGQRFFRDQGAAMFTSTPPTVEYCSLDCRSSHAYRADVQRTVDNHNAFGHTASSSRL